MKLDRPPMGWNSWNSFGNEVNEQLIMDEADALVETGLAALGYNYVIIDDCWSLHERDENGRLVPDPEKFPHGMKYLADYIHAKGLKFGMYSDCGTHTCGGYPASFGHEETDAETFAEWEIDYLKYDYCFRPKSVPPQVLYRRMGDALCRTGRDIVFAACTAGRDETKKWARTVNASTFRTDFDLYDSWQSLYDHAMNIPKSIEYFSQSCMGDLDMLTVGIGGRGKIGITGCTDEEYRLHFSLWALLSSPLIIGCDLRSIDSGSLGILSNRRLIEINQDPAYNMPFPVNFNYSDESPRDTPAYAKLLSNGDFAVGIFNLSEKELFRSASRISLDIFGLPESTGLTLEFEDVWTGERFKVTNGAWYGTIAPHSCRVFYGRVTEKGDF